MLRDIPAPGSSLISLPGNLAKVEKFDPNQPRDARGRWTRGGSGNGSDLSTGPGSHDLPDSRRESMTLNEQIAWARDPARKYPIGPVLGGDTSSGDYRVEHDPDRRFAELWQRTYPGYRLVRDAAMNVLDGKEPLDFIDFDHDPLAVRDESGMALDPMHPQVQRASFIQGFLSDTGFTYTVDDMRTDVASAGRWLADGLRSATTGPRLHRGTTWTRDADPAVGETFTLGPTATSEDLATADRYSRDTEGTMTVFHFSPETRRFSLDPHSDWAENHPEQIVAGTFRVSRVVPLSNSSGFPVMHVELEPVEQP